MASTVTPLRYPGGKTQLFKKVSAIIVDNDLVGCKYIEPFAGGAGLALKLLFEGIVHSVVLNDLDYHIFCFWDAVLNQPQILCDRIHNTEITPEEWEIQREIYRTPQAYPQIDVAFSTFFLNRTNVSGVLRGGMIGGKDQTGTYKLDARFNKEELIKKIIDISNRKSQISLYNLDAQEFIKNTIPNFNRAETFVNFDPPYVNKGSRLYKNYFTAKDHEKLAQSISKCNTHWIVTYDACELIERLYCNYFMESISLNYSTGVTKNGTEILIYGPTMNFIEQRAEVLV